MDTVLIFVPDNLEPNYSGSVYGVFRESDLKTCTSFFVVGVHPCLEHLKGFAIIGSCNRQNCDAPNWLCLGFKDELYVEKVILNNENFPLNRCHVINYSPEKFSSSELLHESEEGDYFKSLVAYSSALNQKPQVPSMNVVVVFTLWLLHSIVHYSNKWYFLTRLSSVGLHLQERSKNLQWLIESYYRTDTVRLHRMNLILSILTDMPLGFMVTAMLSKLGTEQEIFHWIAKVSGDLVDSISVTLTWIMGSPGGLKLNYPLNFILGTFYLYHMYLWWIFLGLVRPVLEYAFFLFLRMGVLGCSFQIALLSDIFSLVSFHLYSIYVYAAKLFGFQLKQICSLSGIFFGRKRNPEPGKVDSYPYNNEQLFVATVCFTVLLFLLPTTLVYYIVFTLLRLSVVMIGGLLTRARYLLEISPIYSTLVWFLNPKKISTTVRLIPVVGVSSSGAVTLLAEPVPATWLETADKCTPSVISKPKAVEWAKLGKSLLNGTVIYQI